MLLNKYSFYRRVAIRSLLSWSSYTILWRDKTGLCCYIWSNRY